MGNSQSISPKNRIYLICGVMVLSVITAGWAFSERPLDNHECFVSITAREMLQSGDWVWPTCNGQPRLEKTPLAYWLVAGLAKITGEVDEFTTRMPSVIFGVLSAAAILYFVNRWLGLRIAVLSTALWATTLGYVRHSHNARPEMALTCFIAVCFLSFYSAITTQNRKRQIIYMLIFWISFGLANLAKGPAPLPLVLIPLFFYIAIFRRWKEIPKLLPITGGLIFLAIVLPWPLAIAEKLNWNLMFWKREFLDRFLGSYTSGDKPLYFYLPLMFQFMLPWVVFVPFALGAPFYKVWDRKLPAMWFLWMWFVVSVAFITISAGKRQHYIMPAMPALAILAGILLEDMAFSQKAFTQKNARNFLMQHLVVLVILLIATPFVMVQFNSEVLSETIIIAAAGLAAILLVGWLFKAGKIPLALGSLFASICILLMLSYVTLINPLNYNRPSRDFTRTVAAKVPASDKLIAYKSASTRFIHYFGKRVPKIETRTEVYELYQQGVWVVAFGGYLDELLENERFEIVYKQENAERHKQKVVAGALLHKSAL